MPSRYRNVYFHKRMSKHDDICDILGHMFCLETKNTWARDDPAILVLIGACLCGMFRVFPSPYISKFISSLVSAIAWGVVYSYSVLEILSIALLMIFRDFLVSGVVIATVLWYLITRFLMSINLSLHDVGSPPTASYCHRLRIQLPPIRKSSGLMHLTFTQMPFFLFTSLFT